MADVRASIETFVEVYNQPGSPVYPLFGEEVAWAEFPGGRRGDREALFQALRECRDEIDELHLEVLSITADAHAGVLEAVWSGVRKRDGTPMRARTIWFLGYRDGKIVEERDYSVMAPAGT